MRAQRDGLLIALCLTACGTTTEQVDASADATANDGASDLDAGAADVIEEWRLCSWDAAARGDDAGVGHHDSCCAGILCFGDCVANGGVARCECGGVVGGCDQPLRCCGDLDAGALVLACGQGCVFTGH